MDEQVLVRVIHGGEHLEEQTQPRDDVELARVAVKRERFAIDTLEHDEWLA